MLWIIFVAVVFAGAMWLRKREETRLSTHTFKITFDATYESGKKESVNLGLITASSEEDLNNKINLAQANWMFKSNVREPVWGNISVELADPE